MDGGSAIDRWDSRWRISPTCACVDCWFHSGLSLLSTIINPISWRHYLVLAIIPGAHIVCWLARHRFPVTHTNLALSVGALLLVPNSAWVHLASLLIVSTPNVTGDSLAIVTVPAMLVLAMPTLVTITLGMLVAWFGSQEQIASRHHERVGTG